MKASRNTETRRQAMLQFLKENGRVSVEQLSERFQTTPRLC
ncbi:DeoR family transcriptional regulator [Oceaniovalibus sp. ACAM 378]|nr:DeoR family transcriptional regulator [Oceaniovalibus sp. ACAM 378]